MTRHAFLTYLGNKLMSVTFVGNRSQVPVMKLAVSDAGPGPRPLDVTKAVSLCI